MKEKLSIKTKYLIKFLKKNKKLSPKKIKKYQKEGKLLKKVDNIFDYKLKEKEKYEANKYILLKTEKKEYDYLYCAELGRFDDKTIFDYKNIKEWDKEWWEFQKNSLVQNNVNETKKYKTWYKQNYENYNNLYMSGEWFRWIETREYSKKKDMIYGSLTGLYGYVVQKITNYIDDEIDKIYPNLLYKPFRQPTFKKIKGSKYSTMYDFETRTGGKEKELEEIKKLYRENLYKIEKLIEKKIKPYENYTFTNYTYDEFTGKDTIENSMKEMIIGGIKAAEEISFKTFLDDFYKKEQPYGIVENLIEDIKKEVKNKYIKEWEVKSKKS